MRDKICLCGRNFMLNEMKGEFTNFLLYFFQLELKYYNISDFLVNISYYALNLIIEIFY